MAHNTSEHNGTANPSIEQSQSSPQLQPSENIRASSPLGNQIQAIRAVSGDGQIASGSLSEYEVETQPLLSSHFTRSRSSYGNNEEDEGDDYGSDRESQFDVLSRYSQLITDKIVKFSRKRFWWFCALGVVAIIILNLSFLPRTSLSRDYRRYHGLHLTKTDVKRNFLLYSGTKSFEPFSNEQQMTWLLQNFTKLNEKNPVNLLHQDNTELSNYIENKFKAFGFKTETVQSSTHLQRPINSSVKLFDGKGVLYDADMLEPGFDTPSYFGYGINGSFRGEYMFANQGTEDDYQLLLRNNFTIEGKAMIIRSLPDSDATALSISDKVLIAQKHGAKGILHYTDFEDLSIKIKSLNHTILRDTVVYNNYGDEKKFRRPSIPCLPISMESVEPILQTFTNTSFFDWKYYPQNPKLEVEITSLFDNGNLRKLTNIIGTLDGIIKDGDIVIGASRDSFTSSNPLSSQVILVEIMRHFNKLVKLGWKPLRNIKFVSFDGTQNGLLGSQAVSNADWFKGNILAFINIDADAITGSELVIDSNPLLEHVIKRVSKLIPFPKDSLPFRNSPANANDLYENLKRVEYDEDYYVNDDNDNDNDSDDDDDNDGDDDGDDDFTSLFRYWKLQDNNTIGKDLGKSVRHTDSLVFQYHMGVPVMNIRFQNDPMRDSAIHTPKSNYYSLQWLKENHIDDNLLLHGLLIRYIGLLLISVAEHEVVDFRTNDYFKFVKSRLDDVFEHHKDQLEAWNDEEVSKYFLLGKFSTSIKFKDLIKEFRNALDDLGELSKIFDDYNSQVQDGLIRDYPWYQLFKKLKLWAQFKVSNYKLLHIEKELSGQDGWFKHFIYDNPDSSSVFNRLETSIEEKKLDKVAKLINKLKDTLDGFNKRL